MFLVISGNEILLDGGKKEIEGGIGKVLRFRDVFVVLHSGGGGVAAGSVTAYDYDGNVAWRLADVVGPGAPETYASIEKYRKYLMAETLDGRRYSVDTEGPFPVPAASDGKAQPDMQG